MGLMPEKIARTKNCRIKKESFLGLFKRNIKCEAKACMHWNFSNVEEPLDPDDRNEKGGITAEALAREGIKVKPFGDSEQSQRIALNAAHVEFRQGRQWGYCGLSAPLEELQDNSDSYGG